MVRIERTTNILESPGMYPATGLTDDQRARLTRFTQIEFIFEDLPGPERKDFLREIILLLLPDYDIWLVLVEPSPRKRSRIRSHKKMFYEVRKDIDPEDRYEEEVDTGQGESLMAGLVRMNKKSLDFWLESLLFSNLRFVYFVKRVTSPSVIADPEQFLQKIVDLRLPESGIAFLNYPRIIADFADENSSLARLRATGADEEIMQFWVSDPAILKLLLQLEARYRSEVEN